MALFDFLKGLKASERKELDKLTDTIKDLQDEVKQFKPVDLSGYAKTKDLPDVSKIVQSEVAKIQVYSNDDKAKVEAISNINTSDFMLKKDLTDTAKYWLDQNSKKWRLFTGTVKGFDPKKTSVDQLTILV